MQYNENECCMELSAQELCARTARAGDLDARAPSDMNIGCRGFDAYLSQMPDYDRALESVRANCDLVNTASVHGVYYTVSACAHRAYRQGDCGNVDRFIERRYYGDTSFPDSYDIAMLKVWAYFYACKNSLSRVNVRIVICFGATRKIKIVEDSFTFEVLKKFYFECLEKIDIYARLMLERKDVILPRVRKAPFPYKEIREGQEQMVRSVYTSIAKGREAFVQAPTGTGKTISALYPAVRALCEGRVDKIFYLTAKTSTSREAFSAMSRMYAAGAHLKTVMISSKDSVCLCPRAKQSRAAVGCFCNSLDCEMARGYYDRVDAAIGELVKNYSGYTQGVIVAAAKKYNVCPYELSLDLSELCDVIICDYNYVFDPTVYFRRYFEGGARGRYVFLIDEAHNLPDRALEMYSASVSESTLALAAASIPSQDSELICELDGFIRKLDECKSLCSDNIFKNEKGEEYGYYISKEPYDALDGNVERLCTAMNSWLRKNRLSPEYARIRALYSEMSEYKKISELYDEHYRFFVEVSAGDVRVRLSCIDPSYQLGLCRQRAVSSIMFSATLEPLDYFSDMLGAQRNGLRLKLPSPFEQSNLALVCVDTVNTRFEEREKSYKKIASCIAGAVSGKAGNYIVFFPSYQYMQKVSLEFAKKYPRVTLIEQSTDMNRDERERFISEFKEDSGVLRVGFCVLGGSFSEGIDLPGTRLIGTVIVGVGIPAISSERNIMREYFENTRENGYDYAYTYPGMNRVLQAAGRVIRTENDRGVVVLLDDRYATEQYKAMLPEQWSHIKYVHSAGELSETVKKFWYEP